ncbi:MAG: hypothetical protein RIS21_1039 [Planctomycetota bacterium]
MNQPAAQPQADVAGDCLLDVFHITPVEPVKAEGVWITAKDGRRYLDFYGGHAVALLGYGHPRLCATLDAQARTLFFQSNAVDIAVRRRAAERLVKFGPKELTRAFFVNSGAEANENALRVAFLATRRPRIIAVTGAFHGRTAGAAAITAGHEKWYAYPNKPFDVTWVPVDDIPALEKAFGTDVAAIILEPVQGVAGAKDLSPEFMKAARALATCWGALFISDEVQCGMGRTGWPFAVMAHGIVPDIITTAKGLGGGFPVSAVLVTDALAAVVKKGDLGTTFGGGPLACAMVETVIDTIEQEDLLPRVRRLGERIRKEAVVGPVVGVQGAGYLIGLRTRRPAKEVLEQLRAKGIMAGSAGDPHIVRLLPPLVLEDAHVDLLIAALKEIPA